jgi:hypothetical protein
MKHLISFSGGMGSFAEAHACVMKYGKENVKLLFADTNMEDEDLYRFMDECVKFLDVELEVIADGRTPFQVFKDVRYMANSRKDPCSKILKRELLNKKLTSEYTPEKVNVHLGIDYSECHRIVDVAARMLPYVYRSTLVEDGRIVPKDYSEQFGIKRPRLYDWGMGHNNCGGFCPKAGLGHYKALFEANPERYAKFESEELLVYGTIGKKHPFLKKQVKGVKRFITLREYRTEFLETGDITIDESFEFGGCGCAI